MKKPRNVFVRINENRDELAAALAMDGDYRIMGYEPKGEFPASCVAVRITGPGLPPTGLPFIVPEGVRGEMWANRWCLALTMAHLVGKPVPADVPDRSQNAPPEVKQDGA